MSAGPGKIVSLPESQENVSGTQLPTAADHPIPNRGDRQQSSNRQTAGEGMKMTRKSALYALAVVVAVVMAAGMVMGTAGAVLADNEGAGVYGTTDSSFSSEPEMALEQSYAGEIREPIETGALPEGSVREEHGHWLNMDVSEQNSSPELRGRLNIQEGGGGE
jgi:hypothetical protein